MRSNLERQFFRLATVFLFAQLLCSCSTIGRTKVLAIEMPPPQSLQATLAVKEISLEDENAARVDSVGVFPWGKFSKDDLQNMRISLERALTSAQASSVKVGKNLSLHVLLRRYLVASSNSAGAALATVAWCVTDEQGHLLFQEQFYASHSVAMTGTLGELKNIVNEAVLKRIVSVSLQLASSGTSTTTYPPMPLHAFSVFESAERHLPRSFQSFHVARGLTFPLLYEINGNVDWNWGYPSDRVNWAERLNQVKQANSGSDE